MNEFQAVETWNYSPARTSRNLQRELSFEKLAMTQDFTVEIVDPLRMQSRLTSFSHARRSSGVTSLGSSSASATVANGNPTIKAERSTLRAITTPNSSIAMIARYVNLDREQFAARPIITPSQHT